MIFKSSYRNIHIPEESIVEYFLDHARKHGDSIAIEDMDTGEHFTFNEILTMTNAFAIALQSFGLKKGDVIGLLSANCAQYIIIMLGAAKCGITTTTCNPQYTHHEITYQFKHSCPKLVIVDSVAAEKAKKASQSATSIREIICIQKIRGMRSLNEFIESYNTEVFLPVKIHKDDMMLLLYSSGTTGLPKGVVSSYHAMATCAAVSNATYGYFKTDALFTSVPMFHMYGVMGVISALMTGTKNVITKRYSVTGFLNAVEKYKVTRFHAVPPMLIAINNYHDIHKYDVSSLKTIMCSAATLAEDVAKEIQIKLKCQVAQLYGMTEFVPICVPDYNRITPISSAGYIPPNTEVKVVNEKTGQLLGPHKPGLLCCRGPQMMKGYFKNPEATAKAIDDDNWLSTGDVGYCDESGRVYVIDRNKDIIKYKGFQVSPAEVEAALLTHPKIADCAVIGVPSLDAGERPKAFIVKGNKSLGVEEIHKYLKDLLATYKQLSGGISFVDGIPKSPSGKILRKTLRTKKSKL